MFDPTETAKALSAPITKLVEVCAAGCGKLYEPTGIRRKARADGDALVIMQEATDRASELSLRAAQRLLSIEERRQENIEAIVVEAKDLLPDHVSETPVDRDWATRFFVECQDVNSEEVRAVWAKILAGEVSAPGSFSRRTLSVLKNMSRDEANLFSKLCAHSLRGVSPRQVFPFVGAYSGTDYWDQLGLSFMGFERLQEAGLVTNQVIGELHQTPAPPILVVRVRDRTYSISPRVPGPGSSLIFGKVELTAAGKELSTVCESIVPDARWEDLERGLSPQFFVVEADAIQLPGGGWTVKPRRTASERAEETKP